MPAALLVVAVVAALSAGLADLSRTAAQLARNRQSTAQALLAADACLADVAAALPAGWDFAALLAGPDGLPGTGDDGTLGAPPGCSASVGAAPGPAAPARILVEIGATAGGGRRILTAVVARAGAPGGGAMLWLDAAAALGAVTGALTLDGVDAVDPTLPATASIAAPRDPATLDAWLAAQAVALTAPGAAPRFAPGPPIADLIARAAGALPPAATLVAAGIPPVAVTLAPGDLTVATALGGAGLLIVDGRVDIAAPFAFSGVVVASRGMRVAGGGSFTLRGSAWLGPGPGGVPALEVDGTASVHADATAVAAADALLPLPRRARVAGVRDGG